MVQIFILWSKDKKGIYAVYYEPKENILIFHNYEWMNKFRFRISIQVYVPPPLHDPGVKR